MVYGEYYNYKSIFKCMPAILDKAVEELKKKGFDESKAYAIATKQLQRSGDLKEGTIEATKKGDHRGEMSKAERAKTRARKYKEERKEGRRFERSTEGRN